MLRLVLRAITESGPIHLVKIVRILRPKKLQSLSRGPKKLCLYIGAKKICTRKKMDTPYVNWFDKYLANNKEFLRLMLQYLCSENAPKANILEKFLCMLDSAQYFVAPENHLLPISYHYVRFETAPQHSTVLGSEINGK